MYIGIDVGGMSIKAGVVDDECRILAKHAVITPMDGNDGFLRATLEAINGAIKDAKVNKSDIKFQLQIGDTIHQVTIHPRSNKAYVEIAKDQNVTFVNCIIGTGRYHTVPQSEL